MEPFKEIIHTDTFVYLKLSNTIPGCFGFFFLSEAPVVFIVPLQDTEIIEKSTTELTCEMSKPDVPVKWFKGTAEVIPGMRYKIRQEGTQCTLEILNAALDDTEDYSCVIVSSQNSTRGKLLVKGRG